ncbi:MAG: transposase [Saprospiraceae bacterium]|nr:transposase [Saprospiraceae bacterium]MBK7810817.1 transposase [Saprospiraceae bacterium]MBK9630412.1 transposase [Saprospiraceae bacterium]
MDQSRSINRRRKYDADFKLQAIDLMESSRNVKELTDSLGVSKKMLYNRASSLIFYQRIMRG